MRYSVTLEHGSDGSCLAWVHELPGCFVRAAGRAEALERLPGAIRAFLEWAGDSDRDVDAAIVEEVESLVETAEDTEALVAADREPLTPEDWARVEAWLEHSRADLRDMLPNDLESPSESSSRTVREELIHIGLVELMYVAWTFDLRGRAGIVDFLGWTRRVAVGRMQELAERDDGSVTFAEWAGAPRPEERTARKAARRLLWHERLHTPPVA